MAIDEHTKKLIQSILEEVGTTASCLKQTLYNANPDNIHENSTYAIVAEKIGYLCDLGLEKLTGSARVAGRAESWLLSPLAQELNQKATEVSHEQ